MTKREAAIVSAYTGYLIGDIDEAHKYIEEIMGRPIVTHELYGDDIWKELRKKSRKDFRAIVVE